MIYYHLSGQGRGLILNEELAGFKKVTGMECSIMDG
jgi:hypothetical protein